MIRSKGSGVEEAKTQCSQALYPEIDNKNNIKHKIGFMVPVIAKYSLIKKIQVNKKAQLVLNIFTYKSFESQQKSFDFYKLGELSHIQTVSYLDKSFGTKYQSMKNEKKILFLFHMDKLIVK